MASYNSHYDAVNSMPSGRVTEVRREWLVRTDEALAQRLQDEEITTHLCGNRHRNTQIREDFPTALSQQKQLEQQARQRQLLLENQAQSDALIAQKVASRLNISHKEKIKQRLRLENEDYFVAMQVQASSQPPPYEDYCSEPNEIHCFERIDDLRLAVQAETVGLPIVENQLQSSASSSWRHQHVHNNNVDFEKSLQENEPATFDDDLCIEALGMSKEEIKQIKERLLQEERDAELARKMSNSDETGSDALLLADMKCAVEAQDGELAKLLQERENQRARRAKQKALLRRQQKAAAAALSEGQSIRPSVTDEYSDPRDIISGGLDKLHISKSMESDINYIEPYENERIEAKANAISSKESSKEWLSHLTHANSSVPSTSNNTGFSNTSFSQSLHASDNYGPDTSSHSVNIATVIDPTYENTQDIANRNYYNGGSTQEQSEVSVVAGDWRNGQSLSTTTTNSKQTKSKGKKNKKSDKHNGCRSQ